MMKRILSALFALLNATLVSAAPFQNGGFEVGFLPTDTCNYQLVPGDTTITGWTVTTGNIERPSTTCWTPSQGNFSLDLVGNGTTGGIQQTFDTVSGLTYEVIFDLAGNPSTLFGSQVRNVTVSVNGTPTPLSPIYFDTTGRSAGNMGWTAQSFQFVASSTSTTLSFVSSNPSGFAGAALDNVRVTPLTPWTGTALSVTNQGAAIGSSPTVVSNGTAGPAVFTYATVNSFCCHTGDWTFETIATTTGAITLNWSYDGYHGTCAAVATLTPYAKSSGGTTFGAPVYSASDTCAGLPPSGGFGIEGQITIFANAGYAYGFQMHASNFDSNGGVQGRLTVTTGTSPTTTTLQSSANPSLTGATVDFTATVAGNAPTGTMMFTRETRTFPLGPGVLACEAVPLVGGSAVCSTNFLFPGDRIVALYSGDFVNAGSISTTLIQQVVSVPPPPGGLTPVLIRSLPFGSAVVPLLIGRVDGAINASATVRLFGGTTCTNGVLGGTIAQIGADESVTSDPNGYFGTAQGGAQGQFVAIGRVTNTDSGPQVSPLSGCVVTAADNDTWPKALRLYGDNVTVPDWIDAAGKARWYRFSVYPGQSIQVTMSGLPADYDLAVFKDIFKEFASELVPANTADLTRLSAQFAPSAFSPSAFSPSAFSPSAFSPSAFSPSAFSPSAFSPSAFSPSAFSPSAFSPSAFSPSAFSPSAFSPSAFSPSAFSPSAFSPSAFSPSAFSPTELQQAFSSAQTRSIIAASMTPGTGNESALVNTWNNTGDFYVRVTGRAGAFSSTPYNLAVAKTGTSCVGVTDTAISTRSPFASNNYNTIVLVDSSKTSLSDTLPGGTLFTKLTSFMNRADVKGVLVDIASSAYGPRIAALKTQAASNVSCPFAKNLLALEIRSIIDAYSANPLRYVVILGNDDAIPFFRYPDQTLLGQESGFVPPVVSSSASEAALRNNFILSQDAYGATNSISLRVSEFPIPGMAVGRLIETPAEIAGMIDAYFSAGAAGGVVSPNSSLVTGYDFLADAATAVRTELACGTGALGDTATCGPGASLRSAVSDSLITPNTVSPADTRTFASGGPWTATDLRQKLLSSRHDVMFLAGHFNASSALAADFTTNLITTDIATADLTNALVFSAGCHSGYNVVDSDAINGVTFPLDWAQAFAQKKATLVAGTGYQYGDTEFLEYSERLYLNFAKQLRAGTGNVAIGEALVKAKRAYLEATPDLRGLHEKAVLEATLFGLPMLNVNMPTGRVADSSSSGVINPVSAGGSAGTLGLRLADFSVTPTFTLQSLNLTNYDLPLPNSTTATWLKGPDGVVTNPAEPAIPLQIVNVTPNIPALVLRGVGFRGGLYSDSTVVPLTGAPTTELRGVHTPFSSPYFFPMRLWSTNYFSALAGTGGTKLLVTPAQHRTLSGNDSTLRKFTSLDLRAYYTDLTSTSNPTYAAAILSDAPTIVRADSSASGGVATFSAQVVGDPSAAVSEVWVTYTDGAGGIGSWVSVNLQQCVVPLPSVCGSTADSQFWKGTSTGTLPADTRYIVQAVNGTGLVSMDDNLGRYYSLTASAPVASAISFSGTVPTTAVYGSTVTVSATLSSSGAALAGRVVTISLGGAARTGTTNGAGSVTVQLPVLATPGVYPISASFGGDTGFLPSAVSATSSITVTKAPTLLTPFTAGVGVVLTSGAQPLIQETVQFLITGPQGVQQVFAITDYAGRASIPPPGYAAGTYSVTQACFAGNATYAAVKLNAGANCSYQFTAFFQPVDPLPIVNSVKAGGAVPVKFSLGGNYGLTIFDVGSPKSQSITCDFSAVVSDIVETATVATSTLSYDPASGQYSYVWKTDKAWAGSCRQLILNFNNGTVQRANFKFK